MQVLALIERLNFGVRQIFNIVILGTVGHVMSVKKWFDDNQSSTSETGYICIKGAKTSGKNVYIF